MAETRTYGLYIHSHYQGAGPDRPVAHGVRDACEAVAHALDSCSMCGVGPGGYSTGTCYQVSPTHRPRGVALPVDVADWSREDMADLLEGEAS